MITPVGDGMVTCDQPCLELPYSQRHKFFFKDMPHCDLAGPAWKICMRAVNKA